MRLPEFLSQARAGYYIKTFARLESYDLEATYSRIMNHQNRSWFYFNAARSFANDGQVDEALRHLRKAVEDGFPRLFFSSVKTDL